MREPGAGMIPLAEAFRRLDDAVQPLRLETELVPVRAGLGRILRAPQHARLALPPFDKSAVDGYALPDGGESDTYRLIETVHAGEVGQATLRAGTAAKVMTGAPVPAGTWRVAMVEHAVESDGSVRITESSEATHVCHCGENLQPGELVLDAGARLSPLGLGNLISAGITEIEVSRPMRVAIISTGNEIHDDPQTLAPGQIMDSNRPMLEALAAVHGLEVALSRRVPDDPTATREAIAEALSIADLVVLSGGVSEGDSDYVTPAVLGLGLAPSFTRVAIKPGKPVTFAAGGRRLILALPGNPVSTFVMFHLFGLRIAAHLQGAPFEPRIYRLRLASPYRRRNASRLEFVPTRLGESGACEPIRYHGSSHLSALTRCDGFFEVPLGVTALDEGAVVPFRPAGGMGTGGDFAAHRRSSLRSPDERS